MVSVDFYESDLCVLKSYELGVMSYELGVIKKPRLYFH